MAPVEHVVADAGAFLRDAALQVRGVRVGAVRSGLGAPAGAQEIDGCDDLGRSLVGHWEKHLYYPGCSQRDSGQGHAQATCCPALRAAFQGAVPGICAAG